MWKSEGSKISKTGPHGLQMLLVLDVMWYFFGTLFYFPLYGKRDTPIFELDSELKIKDEWKGFLKRDKNSIRYTVSCENEVVKSPYIFANLYIFSNKAKYKWKLQKPLFMILTYKLSEWNLGGFPYLVTEQIK